MRKSDFCLNKHKIRAVCKQVLSAETLKFWNSASFFFVLLEEILQNHIYKHMAEVWSAFEVQFCSWCHFPVTTGTIIVMFASLLKAGNSGRMVLAVSISACSKWEYWSCFQGKQGFREKEIQGQRENSAIREIIFLLRLIFPNLNSL